MAIDKLKTKFFTGSFVADVKHYFSKINELVDACNNGSTVAPGGGTPVGIIGSGTVDKLAKFSAATSVEDSSIYDNGSVGIGTTTTTLGKVTIKPNTGEPALVIKANTGDAIIGFNDTGNTDRAKIWVDDTNKFLNIYTNNNNTVFWNGVGGGVQVKTAEMFYTGETQFSGKVGIGMFPASTFQIAGILEYADNATALGAGLTVGAFYRTGDLLKIVH